MGSPITIDHIPKSKPAQQFQFLGKWLVGYDPAEFRYPAILSLLATLQDRLQSQKLVYRYVHLQLGRSVVRNRYFPFADRLFIAHNGVDQRLLKTDPGAFVVHSALAPLARPVRSVSLLFPRLDSDPRWKTMGLPAAQLFLASGLQSAGFQVTANALSLPDENRLSEALKADLTGFTLFEDLLPALRPFLADFKASYDGILAAGGPFPTLAPLAALQHLPQINLFIRGEAEIGLPFILDALNRGDIDALFKVKGFFWQQPGVIVISDLDRVMRPETFRRFTVDLEFLRPEHVQDGLEMNFSRGCNRGCLFCCRVQGRTLRKLPLDKAEELLKQYRDKVDHFSDIRRGVPLERPVCDSDKAGRPDGSPLPIGESPAYIPININDDDILQDPTYAAAIFALLKKYNFRIHGIQTAPASLLDAEGRAKGAVLDMIGARGLYVEDRPLVWLGSDVFLSRRARRLGKKLPSRQGFAALLAELEKRGLRHFHYWISSDSESTWEEFVEELSLIIGFYADFPGFGLLAHAPFVVPYPASRLFGRLDPDAPNLKLRLELNAPDPRFAYRVVERLETRWPQLNALLRNEKAGGEFGFFDLLKAKNFAAAPQGGQTNQIRQNRRMICAAAQLAYHFLKQEQLQNSEMEPVLNSARNNLEKVIERLIEDEKS